MIEVGDRKKGLQDIINLLQEHLDSGELHELFVVEICHPDRTLKTSGEGSWQSYAIAASVMQSEFERHLRE